MITWNSSSFQWRLNKIKITRNIQYIYQCWWRILSILRNLRHIYVPSFYKHFSKYKIYNSYIQIFIHKKGMKIQKFYFLYCFYTPRNEFGVYNVFNPSVSQSVSPVFLDSATPLKPLNRNSWNFVVMKDIMWRFAFFFYRKCLFDLLKEEFISLFNFGHTYFV